VFYFQLKISSFFIKLKEKLKRTKIAFRRFQTAMSVFGFGDKFSFATNDKQYLPNHCNVARLMVR